MFKEHEDRYVIYILYGNVFLREELQTGRRYNISMSNKFKDVKKLYVSIFFFWQT